jgi:hypothetical protein
MSRPPATVRCDSIREACLRSFHTFIAPPLEPTGTGCERNESADFCYTLRIFAYRHTIRTRREEAKSGCGRSAGHQYKVLPHRKL